MNDARQKLLALLESAFASRGTALHETLLGLYADDQHANGTPLKDYSKEEREALSKSSAHQKDDTGRGPFAAWWAANEELPLYSTLMMSNNAGFRDGACVFWDDDRLKRYNLLAYFAGNAPESELALLDTEEEQNAMEASFDARSAIWQNNGRGYWSRHGESRII
ncbi:hypothetical protein SCUCBS95973_006710 [Sporothrix curviconia]|uniref:Uncharacterized protein n=1 Tax=Sporothrix curviconia TaxID=1260050 RepID=A0ABP0C9W9_9PEZI